MNDIDWDKERRRHDRAEMRELGLFLLVHFGPIVGIICFVVAAFILWRA